MAEINPNEPQVRDPELEAELVRALSIVGPLGILRVADIVVPTISMGNVVQQTVEVRSPAFRSTDVFSAGILVAAPANTVHADTGPLAAGVADLQISISPVILDDLIWNVVHRNATNTGDLAVWRVLTTAASSYPQIQAVAYEFALNERLRITNNSAISAGQSSIAFIFARIRS